MISSVDPFNAYPCSGALLVAVLLKMPHPTALTVGARLPGPLHLQPLPLISESVSISTLILTYSHPLPQNNMAGKFTSTKTTGKQQPAGLSPTFLLCLQAFLAGLLAYLVLFTHTKYPGEAPIWIISKFSLVVCFLVLLALQALA